MIDTTRGKTRICVGQLRITLLIDENGKASTKVEEWMQSPEVARLFLGVSDAAKAHLQNKIDTASPIITLDTH